MAGDWIKMRMDLQTHPKVVRIMSALRADKFRTIGGLHAVWCVFDSHSEDGVLPGYTADAMDLSIGWPGFAAAMRAVDWLDETPQGLTMPRFDNHNGKSAKRRASDTERKRSVRTVRNLSANDAEKTGTREEKRREDIDTPIGVSGQTSKPTQSRFTKPTLEEVRDYCQERKNQVDPQRFINHYESNGWRVGKNAMKNWKAAVHTWEKTNFDSKPSKQSDQFPDYRPNTAPTNTDKVPY